MRKLFLLVLFIPFSFLAQSEVIGIQNKDTTHESKVNNAFFVGGQEAWKNFLMKHLNVYKAFRQQDSTSIQKFGNSQRVKVKFTVCEDGSLCDYSVVNLSEVSESAATEALRVMKLSPKWQPALKNSVPLKTFVIQPIVFYLQED
jgi:periplasmic protein TonB